MTVEAEDHGTDPSSLVGYAFVTVIYAEYTTMAPPTTTTPMPCFFCTTGGICVFSMLMCIVAGLLGIGIYSLWRYCLRDMRSSINWNKIKRLVFLIRNTSDVSLHNTVPRKYIVGRHIYRYEGRHADWEQSRDHNYLLAIYAAISLVT